MVRRTNGILAAAACMSMTGVASAQTYHVVDLGTLGALGDTEAFGLSRVGVTPIVVGFATKPDHAHRAFLSNGAIHEISPLAPDTQSVAYAVDALGRVVGTMYQLGEVGARAFRTGGAVLAGLGNFTAHGVNDIGDVAGFMSITETAGLAGELVFDHACVYRGNPATLSDLGTIGGSHWSRAYAVNNAGRVVGCSGSANDTGSRAVVWIGSAGHDLGTFAGTPSGAGEACAYATNDDGIAVGYCTGASDPGVRYAAAWWVNGSGQVTSVSNLGALPVTGGKPTWSYAYGINDRGAVVGQSNGRAFLFDYGRMKDVNDLIPPGWFVVSARAINDSDRIAAWGVNQTNEPHPLLLVPCFGDINRDGLVSVQDIFDFLAAYFANDLRADMDRSGTVSVQDIFDYLGYYFSGPC